MQAKPVTTILIIFIAAFNARSQVVEKPDYKNNSTLVFCKSVDDKWNAAGVTTKIKAGTPIRFLYKAKDKLSQPTMVWRIVRVKPDGKEENVNDLVQDAGDNPYRYLATDDVWEFGIPGKYRVYLIDKNTYGTYNSGKFDYYGKAELTVE